jgi:DNA-binding response OmpR family regulator
VRILIADNEPAHLFLLEMFLRKWGYEVICTDNGREARGILERADGPRMAILDWDLAELEGTEVCRAARRSPGRPYIYILLLTARAQKADIKKGLAAGADDYVVKPYDPEDLRRRLLAGCRQLESAAAPASDDGRCPGHARLVAVQRP